MSTERENLLNELARLEIDIMISENLIRIADKVKERESKKIEGYRERLNTLKNGFLLEK